MVLTLTLKTLRKKPVDKYLSTFKASEDLFSALLEYIQITLSYCSISITLRSRESLELSFTRVYSQCRSARRCNGLPTNDKADDPERVAYAVIASLQYDLYETIDHTCV
jgi:hypothetical protein